jgi:VanZ family protein
MSTLKISNYARQGYTVFFPLFLFFSAIFCMSTRTNNLLHLSILLLLLSLLNKDNRQALAESIRQQWPVYSLLVVFCVYYALSNIWGHTPQHIDSPLTHGTYLIFYLLLLTTLLGHPRTRHLALLSVVAGSRCSRLDDGDRLHAGPQGTPGFAGESRPDQRYRPGGLLRYRHPYLRDAAEGERQPLLYVPMAIMLVMLFLTQSRGPIIALLVAFVCTLHLHVFTRRNLLIVAALALVLGALFFFTPVGDLLLARFEELGTQSGLRLSIWHHTLRRWPASRGWVGV